MDFTTCDVGLRPNPATNETQTGQKSPYPLTIHDLRQSASGKSGRMPLHERDIYYFIDVTLAHLNKITGNEIVLRDPTIEFQSLVFSAFTGLLHLKGSAEGFVYLTASQQFLQHLHNFQSRTRATEEDCRREIGEVTATMGRAMTKRFGPTLEISEPRVFSTVPDDPIEMPPGVFVQPLIWRKEHAYLVLGLASSETPPSS